MGEEFLKRRKRYHNESIVLGFNRQEKRVDYNFGMSSDN